MTRHAQDPIVKRNRMPDAEIKELRSRRLRLIALEKKRAAIVKGEKPLAIAKFQERIGRMVGLDHTNEAELERITTSLKDDTIEKAIARKGAIRDRLKKIVAEEIKRKFSEEDRKERPLYVRLEEEALDELYQESIYEGREEEGLDL